MIEIKKNPPAYADAMTRILEAADHRGMPLTQFNGDPAQFSDRDVSAAVAEAAYSISSSSNWSAVGVLVSCEIRTTPHSRFVSVITAPEHHAEWTRRLLELSGRTGLHLVARDMPPEAVEALASTLELYHAQVGGVQ